MRHKVTKKKLRVGLDLDDVVVEFINELVVFTNAIKRTDYSIDDITSYDCNALFDSPEEKDEIIGMFYNSYMFKNLPFTNGFDRVYKRLSSKHHIYFITARYGDAIPITRQFFKEQELPVDKLFFSKNKGFEAKRLGLDLFVDDALHNLEHIAVNSSTKPVVFNRPWNQDNDTFHRVYSWKDVEQLVRKF